MESLSELELTQHHTQKYRFMDKKVREISRFFVFSRTSLPTNLHPLVHFTQVGVPITLSELSCFSFRLKSYRVTLHNSNARRDERRK